MFSFKFPKQFSKRSSKLIIEIQLWNFYRHWIEHPSVWVWETLIISLVCFSTPKFTLSSHFSYKRRRENFNWISSKKLIIFRKRKFPICAGKARQDQEADLWCCSIVLTVISINYDSVRQIAEPWMHNKAQETFWSRLMHQTDKQKASNATRKRESNKFSSHIEKKAQHENLFFPLKLGELGK